MLLFIPQFNFCTLFLFLYFIHSVYIFPSYSYGHKIYLFIYTYKCDFFLLFSQMRYTKKISMFPVGLITKYGVSTPIVRNGTIAGFYDGWNGGRKYPVCFLYCSHFMLYIQTHIEFPLK